MNLLKRKTSVAKLHRSPETAPSRSTAWSGDRAGREQRTHATHMEKQHRTLRSFHDSYAPRCNRRAIGRDTDARTFIGAATKAASPQHATGLTISNKRPILSEMKLEKPCQLKESPQKAVAYGYGDCAGRREDSRLPMARSRTGFWGDGNWGFLPN